MSNSPADLATYYPSAYQRLVGTLCVMGVPSHDAAEIAQEAFVRLIPRWSTIRGYDSPDGWLRTVAWRIWLNRKRADRLVLVADPPDPGSDGPPTPTGLDADLETALGSLPEGQREAIALHYLADLPVRRIAAELDVAEGTVKARLHRGRVALARQLTHVESTDG